MSWTRAGRAREAGGVGRAGGGGGAGWAHADSVSATATNPPLLRDLINRLDRLVEIRAVGLCGARLARPRGEHVAARLAERHLLFLLPLVELHRDRQRRLVEAGLGRCLDERARPHVRELREQAVHLVLVDVAGSRADAAPLVGSALALTLRAIEHHRLAVARDLDVRRVERPELEQILAAIIVGAFLQV